MATGTRLMQEINDQFLHCKICFENFRDPKTLTCLHTFCCACLQQQYDQEVSSRTSRYSIYTPRQVTCPLCRKKTDLPTGGVRRLPENFLVSNLTEVLAKRTASKIPPCEICSSVRAKNVDACSKCLDCSKLLCKDCVDLHLATKVTQQHSLIDLEGEKDIECKVHPEENVRFYCDPCEACICVVCAFQEHRDHEVCSLSDGSNKYRSNLESLLNKCKERLASVGTRLNAIEKYETVVKDVKERIRDITIGYIAQVRAKEKELVKRIEEEYGGEIQEFVNHKQSLQENMDELQSTCNLTDIMLKDKGVELLLVKKEIEGKMTQLLEPALPEVPSEPKYDVRFVPGNVALGRLSFGGRDDEKESDNEMDEKQMKKSARLKEAQQSNGCLSYSQFIDPDVITNTTQTDRCKTNERSTSMRSDMKAGVQRTDIQIGDKSVTSGSTDGRQVETRECGVIARVGETRARGTMTDRSDVRSFPCQTDHVQTAQETETPSIRRTTRDHHDFSSSYGAGKTSTTSSRESGPSGASSSVLDADVKSSSDARVRRKLDTSSEFYQSNSSRDRAPAPDLLPLSAGISVYNNTPARKIRSIKSQTEISAQDVDAAISSTDQEFVNSMIQAQQAAEMLKREQENASVTSRLRDRSRRARMVDASSNTIHAVRVVVETKESETSPESVQCKDAGVHVQCEASTIDTQTLSVQCEDSSTCTDREGQGEKATSTPAVRTINQETSTPVVALESKVTWTDKVSTSDRATITMGTKTQDRATGTLMVKTMDMGSLVKPYTQTVTTNTPTVSSSDHESQTAVETSDQGTSPDSKMENLHMGQQKAATSESVQLDSSVDFMTPPQSPVKHLVQTCDSATDAFKIPSSSKSTETAQVKTTSSSTETPSVQVVDKDTATNVVSTIDRWTETIVPQLISTGVTPPIPATLEVGVSTTVVLTDEQATCTDMKAYRDTHTETVTVVCDNETLTEAVELADAQTSAEIQTESRECETDKLDVVDEGSITDYFNPWEAVERESQATQCETPIFHTRETNTTRHRRKSKDVQTFTNLGQCPSCGRTSSDDAEPPDSSKSARNLLPVFSKELKDSSTMPHPLATQDVGTMAISCLTCHHEFHETAIQTSQPLLYDKASATSFDLDQDFLERALSREYHDAATSTESLPYIGLLSEIDVDELIVVPEAAFELVSDTEDSDHSDLIMVDDETSTDFLQYVEAGTQTLVPTEDSSAALSMAESNGSKGVGEVIKSLISSSERRDSVSDSAESKYFVSIGVNTAPKMTFEKETCTPIRHLFSKGTMTFYVSKLDKSTSTLNQARIITGSTLSKAKSVDKITMTSKAEKKDIGVETVSTPLEGKITECISKLRNVSERLNSPPARKDNDTFFGRGFVPSKVGAESTDQTNSPMSSSGTSSSDKPEEERQRQLKTLLEQTNALLKPKDKSPIRKPQPITTLKGRKPANLKTGTTGEKNSLTVEAAKSNSLQADQVGYGSKSLPREFSERPSTVRMGSQPLPPSRLPLLRYNSAPGRIATVPAQTLLKKSGQTTPKIGRSSSPRISPSKIPITKKLSPPELDNRQQSQQQKQQPQTAMETRPLDTAKPQLRRPLPSITETRTPSSCSDSSTNSRLSAGSAANPSRISTDSVEPTSLSSRVSTTSSTIEPSSSTTTNRLSMDSATTTSITAPSRSPSMNTSMTMTSEADGTHRKSSTDTTHSATSTETVDEKVAGDDKSSAKKGGMGFVQRLLARNKKKEVKKEPVHVMKSAVPTADAVAALASAPLPQPAAPAESYAHVKLQHPPHHYPPLPEPKASPQPRVARPCVYVNQRLVAIQQDNLARMREKPTQHSPSGAARQDQPGSDTGEQDVEEKDKPSQKQRDKDKEKVKKEEREKEKAKKEQKMKSKKEEKEKAKKEEKLKAEKEKEKKKKVEKEKSKVKAGKSKSKKTKAVEEKAQTTEDSKKKEGAVGGENE